MIELFLRAAIVLLKFPNEMRLLLTFLEKSPEEKRIELTMKIRKEIDDFEKTGRPTW